MTARAAEKFGRSPALDYLGILPDERVWVWALDVAAFGVCEHLDAERAENEARAMKNLPPLPSRFGRKHKPQSTTVTINVGGEKREVPLPPPMAFYDREGRLVMPDKGVRRF